MHNRIHTVQEEGFGQLELPDLSWEVAREAVLNAVTHRDYFIRQGVQVVLYRDRLEITSPGGFIGGITPPNALRHPPVHRNERLARVFQTIGLVNRVGLGVDRMYEGLLRLGKDVPRYSADETHVRLVIPLETDERFAICRQSVLDRWAASTVLQLAEDEAARRLADLRERGYLTVRGRGRAATYALARSLAERLRGRAAVEAEVPLEEEHVRLRIRAVLRERGRLSNADMRRLSGFSRVQVYRVRVYRLVKQLEASGEVRIMGKGRGAHIVLARPVSGSARRAGALARIRRAPPGLGPYPQAAADRAGGVRLLERAAQAAVRRARLSVLPGSPQGI
ncbi:MAG TPA: ATP-binding protein [Gemmatimonadaceae bacterium]|nr:ATP-binding protein [Gemmatimonadaceae bacterium]